MSQTYEWEEHANLAIEDIGRFINLESQFLQEEHKLESSLLSLDYIFAHLDELIPEELHELRNLITRIIEILLEIRESIETEEFKELRFKREETGLLQKLEEKVAHREWKLVKGYIELETNLEREIMRLQINEIKVLHSKFISLAKLIKEAEKIIKSKEGYERVGYYLRQLYRIINAYERIVRHLWKKERIIKKKLENTY